MCATCKECGTIYPSLPPLDCLRCGSGNITTEADNVPSGLPGAPEEDYINKMLRHLLVDLCEKVCNGPAASVELRDNQIEQTLERMRPYVVSK